MTAKAKESQQIQKARRKIEKQLKSSEKKMSPEALSAMTRLIRLQLNRQQPGRINLKKRQVTASLEENPRYAKTESKFVLKLISQIRKRETDTGESLEGRIKTLNE